MVGPEGENKTLRQIKSTQYLSQTLQPHIFHIVQCLSIIISAILILESSSYHLHFPPTIFFFINVYVKNLTAVDLKTSEASTVAQPIGIELWPMAQALGHLRFGRVGVHDITS